MCPRAAALATLAALCALPLTGCGGGGSSSTQHTISTKIPLGTLSIPTVSIPKTTRTTPPPGTGGDAQKARLIADCRAAIAGEPSLSATLKSRLQSICDKAASADLAGAHTAARKVCVEVVNAAPISPAFKEQARARCNKL